MFGGPATTQPFGREPAPPFGLELPLLPPGREPPPPPDPLLLPEPGRVLAMQKPAFRLEEKASRRGARKSSQSATSGGQTPDSTTAQLNAGELGQRRDGARSGQTPSPSILRENRTIRKSERV